MREPFPHSGQSRQINPSLRAFTANHSSQRQKPASRPLTAAVSGKPAHHCGKSQQIPPLLRSILANRLIASTKHSKSIPYCARPSKPLLTAPEPSKLLRTAFKVSKPFPAVADLSQSVPHCAKPSGTVSHCARNKQIAPETKACKRVPSDGAKNCIFTPSFTSKIAFVFDFFGSKITGSRRRASYLRKRGVLYRPYGKICLKFQTREPFSK